MGTENVKEKNETNTETDVKISEQMSQANTSPYDDYSPQKINTDPTKKIRFDLYNRNATIETQFNQI